MTRVTEELTLRVGERAGTVSALLDRPAAAWALYVLAHGAGAGMRHPFLESVARGLAERRIATLRYQFPYMEARGRRPDPPAVAEATVRAAVQEAVGLAPGVPLVAGGKSFGGRMTSSAQANEPLPGVRGLVFLGFPLHSPGRPGDKRAEHLARVHLPMLFLQGTRDEFADLSLLRPLIKRLGRRATLHLVEGADHSFHVLKRSGRTDADVLEELVQAIVEWAEKIV
ncbi:MAG TPA: alpha/beta family hydrolase [Gemmatimonadales bacterium]|nr:alpha/beta family hydrolase [Gemmatimonadales bacterium]